MKNKIDVLSGFNIMTKSQQRKTKGGIVDWACSTTDDMTEEIKYLPSGCQ